MTNNEPLDFSSLNTRQGATEKSISDFEQLLGKKLPEAYVDLLKCSNGLEGFVKEAYIVLWPVEQLAELNKAYCISDFAPGLLLIGSNGADLGYALDTRYTPMPILELPFIGMCHNEEKRIASNIGEFLEYLISQA